MSTLSYEHRSELLRAVARLIWDAEISISEFYSVLGIELDDLGRSDPDNDVAKLAGILEGWGNPLKSAD